MQRKRAWMAIGVAIVLVGGGAWHAFERGAPRLYGPAAGGEAVAGRLGASHGATDADRGSTPRATHFAGVRRNRDGLALADDLMKPASRAEQRWLDRNGYFATAEQHMAYVAAGDAQLDAAARHGDVVAALELDFRKLRTGDASAEARLRDLAADGASSAASMLGDHFATGASRDPARAYAYKRVAEMLGDNRMGLMRDFSVATPADPLQRLEAEALALDLYRDILERRRTRRGPAAPISDPRPLLPD